MGSGSARVRIVAALAAVLAGCTSDSPTDPLERASKIDAASAVDFSAVVGTIATPSPTVRVTDKDGHPVRDVQVAFSVTAGNGLVNPSLAATDADGRASATWTLGTTASANTLKAVVGALAPVVFSAKGVAGPATMLERASGDNQIASVGAVASSPIMARVLDAFRNPVAGASVTFTVIAGGGTITPPTSITDSTGLVSASWRFGAVEGVQSVRAQMGGLSVLFIADTFGCPGSTDPTPCTGFGELVFVRSAENQIYRITVNGTGLMKLTVDGNNSHPVWSPDGTRIAFIRYAPVPSGQGTSDVYLMNADGSNLVRRTTGRQFYSVTWSPDGSLLAVDGPSGGDSLNIYTMSVDTNGSGPTVLRTNGASPSWSPDGRIAFARPTGYYDNSQIYVMNADGTGAHRATPDSAGWNWGPAWSPDGQKISFTRCINNCAIYTINVDGSALTQVTTASGGQDAKWSPDGKWLALTVYGTNSPSLNYVPAAGGVPRMILSGAFGPSWRPRTP